MRLRTRKTTVSYSLVAFLCLVAMISSASAQDTLQLCIDHYPTDHMFVEELPTSQRQKVKSMDEPFGFAVNSMLALTERLNVKLTFTNNTPFQRCLLLMQKGKTDAMWGLLANQERESYMHLFEYKGSIDKIFVLSKSQQKNIASFEDLSGLSVGVVRGFNYFPAFDKSKGEFIKHEVNTIQQGLQLLRYGRIDTMIMLSTNLKDYVQPYPELAESFKVAEYVYRQKHPVHIALSKHSALASRHEEIRKVVDEMRAEGKFLQLRQDFNQWYYGDINLDLP